MGLRVTRPWLWTLRERARAVGTRREGGRRAAAAGGVAVGCLEVKGAAHPTRRAGTVVHAAAADRGSFWSWIHGRVADSKRPLLCRKQARGLRARFDGAAIRRCRR